MANLYAYCNVFCPIFRTCILIWQHLYHRDYLWLGLPYLIKLLTVLKALGISDLKYGTLYYSLLNQVTYGTKSLGNFGPKIWNSLLHHAKSAENLEAFKKSY